MLDKKKKILLISDDEILSTNNLVWNNKISHDENISITNFIEDNSDDIKQEYLNLVNDIENIEYKDKKLFNHFLLQKSFSFFWTTDFYEKSVYKNPKIINQLKLIAVKKIIEKIKPKEVKIELNSLEDSKSIFNLCNMLKIKSSIRKNYSFKNVILNHFFVKVLFSFLKFLRFVWVRFSTKKINFNLIKEKNNLFFTYSAYSDFNKIKKGIFNSIYWNPLLNKKILRNQDNIWCNIFFEQKNSSISFQIRSFQNINNKNYNFFIEQLFDFKIFFNIIFNWFKNVFKIFFIRKNLKKYLKERNYNYLENFIEKDFVNSFIGIEAFSSYYYFFLIEKLSKKIFKIKNVFYLFENQGWEKSLIYNFYSKSNLIAINHATIRYWDLRFNFHLNGNNKYLPNFYAANSNDSFKKLLKENFPISKIIKLEALRFFDLAQKISKNKIVSKSSNKILIVSDFSDKSNNSIIEVMKNIDKTLLSKLNFTLKEHPLKKLNIPDNFKIEKNDDSLIELKKNHNLAIVSNTTSAITDLIMLGYHVIALLDKNTVNLSPLRGSKKINFIKDFTRISDIIEHTFNKANYNNDDANQFFYYNEDLNFWKKILNNDT